MGFWIFMSIINLLIPLTMLGFGMYFLKHTPKSINHLFGYRTTMSMKNTDTWAFAHNHCGRVWKKVGLIMLIPTIIINIATYGEDTKQIGTAGGLLCLVQVVLMIGSIIPTEKALTRNFDKNGNKIGISL